MARINAVSEGQPLTYELINQIINEVNKIKEVPEDFGQSVEVYGPDLGMSEEDTVKIVTGEYEFSLTAKDLTRNLNIPFRSGKSGTIFNKDNVIVTASVVDTAHGKKQGGVQMATLTITDVTKTNFEARIQVLKSVNDKVDLKVHYIAIGAGPKTT
jgi:hypothetical protein